MAISHLSAGVLERLMSIILPGDREICKDRRVRIIIECPERILHLEAGYIYADCPLD